jgi:hypothetical protein
MPDISTEGRLSKARKLTALAQSQMSIRDPNCDERGWK